VTVTFWVVEAGAYVTLPNCEAVTVQVPVARKVAVLPAIVQTDGVEEVKVTGRPELEVALKMTSSPTVTG
jgi:hypothetical protein